MNLPPITPRHIGAGALVAFVVLVVRSAPVFLTAAGAHHHGASLPGLPTATTSEPADVCAGNLDELAPAIPARMADQTIPVCTDAAAILYSLKSCDPVWSAERLTPERVTAARQLKRISSFHDEHVLEPRCLTFSRFTRSGWDRGHMSPNGDMPDRASQYDSFSMANVVPQDPNNNRRLWAFIETAVRDYVAEGHTVYVVTGPLFVGATIGSLEQTVAIPTRLFKAVYDPDACAAGVFIADNAPGARYSAMSLDDFARRYGITPFPTASQEARKTLAIPQIANRAAQFAPAFIQLDKIDDAAD